MSPAVESTRLVELHAMGAAATATPGSGMTERWDAAGTGVAAEMADRTWWDAGATGSRTGTASVAVSSVSHLVALALAIGVSNLRYGFSMELVPIARRRCGVGVAVDGAAALVKIKAVTSLPKYERVVRRNRLGGPMATSFRHSRADVHRLVGRNIAIVGGVNSGASFMKLRYA